MNNAAYQKFDYFCLSMLFDSNFLEHPLYLLILLGSLVLSVLIFLFYYWIFFRKFAFFKHKEKINLKKPPVSVVIAAKNEYLNLKENLPFILGQNYPDFEVIIIDDHSQDDTTELLSDLTLLHSHLKVLKLKDALTFFEGKKFPLSIGIKEAQNPIILLTDADCRPSSSHWISSIIKKYSTDTKIILGYGKFYKKRFSFLNLLIRFDTVHSAIQYFSAALSKMPYMGVGRNLSYKKDLFLKNDGFTSHYNVISGDDDLFISQVANKQNTSICIDSESYVFSTGKNNFTSWWYQKKRHFTTGKHYRFKHKLYLGFYHLNILLFPAIATILIALKYNILICVALILVKLVNQWIIFGKATGKLKEKKLLLISPLLEIVFAIINPLIHLSNIINKPGKWE